MLCVLCPPFYAENFSMPLMNSRDFCAWQTLSWFFAVCFVLFITHSTRTYAHTNTRTHTHVRVYATLHPQHRKTYYDDNVDVSCGSDCDAPLSAAFCTCACACVCEFEFVWVSVGSSRSYSYYYYYMLVLFVLLRFTLVFGFYLFAISVWYFCLLFLRFTLLPDLRESSNARSLTRSHTRTRSLAWEMSLSRLFTVAAYARLFGACKRRFLFVQ